jgi:hypothetical protein
MKAGLVIKGSVCKKLAIMADLIDTLMQNYPDNCEKLQEEIKSLKRKLENEDEKDAKMKKMEFKCETCFKSYRYKKDLTRHILSHSTFFKCQLCDCKFRRKDYLKKHVKSKHEQYGGRQIAQEKTLPDSSQQPEIGSSDHGYACPSSAEIDESTSQEKNHTAIASSIDQTSTEKRDHNYAEITGQNQTSTENRDHNYATTETALNRAIQDFTIQPNQHEQYDMLTFFANVKPRVQDILSSRLQNSGIKYYLSVQVELIKETLDGSQSTSPHFRSRTSTILNLTTFDEQDLNESFQKMFESFEKYIRESSGWVLKKVLHLIIHTVKYTPLSASSYLELPQELRRLQSLLNIRNTDLKCFLWSCLASIHPKDSPLVCDYEIYENELNMQGIDYPVSINQINKFESQNPSVSVNVFTYQNKEVLPFRITKQRGREHNINLLLLQSETKSHYVLIKNLDLFLDSQKKFRHGYYYCEFCLHGFVKESLRQEHIPYCQVHGEQKIELPSNKDCFLEFKDYEKTLRVPYVIYADFETLNKPLNGDTVGCTTQTQLLEPCSFGYKVICTDSNFSKDIVTYRGPDASYKLLECLLKESGEIQQNLKNIKPLTLSAREETAFQLADRCCLCKKYFLSKDKKARHHDHTSGKYIGAAHMNCNLQCKQVNFIPVIFHNLKNFDAHLLCQSVGSFKDYKIKCIPQTMEKYISFSVGSLRFIDSFAFLPSSLETLVDNLTQDGLKGFKHFQTEIKDHTELLLRKGVYPYEYMNQWGKFEEQQLPPMHEFYSSLTNENISMQEYEYAVRVFEACGCKSLGEYHDLYLKTDVLLLADVFENFRDMSLKCYDLDPCHFYTSPGLSWQAMLKMTDVSLELMTDIDQILFIEKGIRGGISQISNRYKKANNPYLSEYDPTKEKNFLAYYDINNLYGLSLSDRLPIGFFRFLSEEEIKSFDVRKIPEDGSKGYILEVDLEYPENLHDSHNDYPLAPERKFIPNEKLSPYAQRVLKKLHGKQADDPIPPRAKVEKLLTTLEDKEKYVLHYKNLQLYLRLGMKLKKIHRILEFQQEAFMKPYVEFNTNMRKQAKTTFEKNFYKLMNNSVFGKYILFNTVYFFCLILYISI